VLLATAGVALIFLVLARDMTQLVKQAVRARTSARGEIEQIASALDVSRRRSEAFEARLRLTLVSARVKLFAINCSGEIVWASEAQIGLLGDRALPVRLTDLVVQPAPEAIAEHVSRAYLSGQTARFEIAVKSPDDGSRKWFLVTISGSDFYEEGALLGVAVDISDNKSREERNFWLTRELMHRTRNMLAIIQSLARHAAPDDPASKTFVPGFLARIYAISAVHDLLVASSYSRCGLRELVAATCGEDARRQDPRVAFAGVDIQLNPDATQTIGLALHELYASSRAHGALLSPQGAVAICSNIDGEGAAAFLRLDWKEVGQSVGAINADRLAAFIVKTNLPRMLNGKFTEHSESDGLYYTMTLPMDKVSVTEHASEPR
jgi:two-component sensor histidine kinase